MRIAYSTQLTIATCNQGHLEHVAGYDTEREKNDPHCHSENNRGFMDLWFQRLNLIRIHLYGFWAHGALFFCCGYRDVIHLILGGFLKQLMSLV